jgi:hypothetical protein
MAPQPDARRVLRSLISANEFWQPVGMRPVRPCEPTLQGLLRAHSSHHRPIRGEARAGRCRFRESANTGSLQKSALSAR